MKESLLNPKNYFYRLKKEYLAYTIVGRYRRFDICITFYVNGHATITKHYTSLGHNAEKFYEQI